MTTSQRPAPSAWNVIAKDRKERKAKRTKLDGVLLISEKCWLVQVGDVTAKKPPLKVSLDDVRCGFTCTIGSFDIELIDPASEDEEASDDGAFRRKERLRHACNGRGEGSTEQCSDLVTEDPTASMRCWTAPARRQPFKPVLRGGEPHVRSAPSHMCTSVEAPLPGSKPRTALRPSGPRHVAADVGTPARISNGLAATSATPKPKTGWALDSSSEGMLVVDEGLSSSLRPHQRKGVQFMYECLAGIRGPGGGCILADSMGLGKTVQTLTLVATLERVRPLAPRGWREPVSLTAVVCPASLVGSWEAEVNRWGHVKLVLGGQRMHAVRPSSSDGASSTQLRQFLQAPAVMRKLLIISYDQVRRLALQLSAAPVDLLVCDEGHRLKSVGGNQTMEALAQMRAQWRLILTATPLQNNLSELWAMVNFLFPSRCPLGDLASFRARFVDPIEAAAHGETAAMAPEDVREGRTAELNNLLHTLTLRRDVSVLRGFLPPRHEFCLFTPLTGEQAAVYGESVCRAREGRGGTSVLATVAQLLNVCSHPALAGSGGAEEAEEGWGECYGGDDVPAHAEELLLPLEEAADPALSAAYVRRSAKLAAVERLLEALFATGEKVVIVCRFRRTLWMCALICSRLGAETVRLDGTTAAASRQDLVNGFNICTSCRTDNSFAGRGERSCAHAERGARAFLLTARAGGVGLTIVGASRMVIVECDWNPAVDVQAMGRIYREGQRRAVHIYRFFSAFTIEEKMLQRQLAKKAVADEVVDGAIPPMAATDVSMTNWRAVDGFLDASGLLCPYHPERGTCETAQRAAGQGPRGHCETLTEAARRDPAIAAAFAGEDESAGELCHACSWDELLANTGRV